MPVETVYDAARKVLIHRALGTLSIVAIVRARRNALASGDYPQNAPALWDLRQGSAADISFDEVWEMVEGIRQWGAERPNFGGRTAILVTSDVNYGMARIYASLADQLPRQTRVFRSESEALAWLQEQA